MANYSQLDNGTAQQIVLQQFEGDANYQAFKASFEAEGKQFFYDRIIGLVGVNPEKPGESYTMAIVPSFVDFNFEADPSHEAASIVCFSAGGVRTTIAANAVITHNPLQIASITLKEIGTDGSIVDTMINRVTLVNQTPEQIAAGLSTAHLNSPNAKVAPTNVEHNDMATIAASALDELLNDNYASGLYPTGGVGLLSADGVIAGRFSQAIGLRAFEMEPIFGIDIVVCTSCSSNACTSSSSTLKL